MEVVRAEGAAGDDIEVVWTQADHCQVAFDAAALVAELGIDDAANRLVEIGGSEALERRKRAGPLHVDLAEGGLVDEGDALAHGVVLVADRLEPVGLLERRDVLGLDTFGREPVGPLPAAARAVDTPLSLEDLIERAAAYAAR